MNKLIKERLVELNQKIHDLAVEIDNDPSDLATSTDAVKKLAEAMDRYLAGKISVDRYRELEERYSPLADVALKTSEREGYLATIRMDLMYCPCRYVITNTTELSSPAGFHPDERVFEQTKIAIHTDDVTKVPPSNVDLYIHTITK